MSNDEHGAGGATNALVYGLMGAFVIVVAVLYTMLAATRMQCGAWPQPDSLQRVVSFFWTGDPGALGAAGQCAASPAFAWALVAVWGVVVLVAGIVIGRAVARRRHAREQGLVTKDELTPMHYKKALKRARARHTEAFAALSAEPPPQEQVIRVGSLDGQGLYAQHEDSMLVLAPPRSGKTMFVAVELILDAPGPVLVTGTKADILLRSAHWRRQYGSVEAFDLMGVTQWPHRIRWDPIPGCEDPEEAMYRGKGWAAGGVTGEGGNARFFNERAAEVLGYYLHAAAIKPGGSLRDVVRWGKDFEDEEPARLLESSPAVREAQWADSLRTLTQSGAAETVGSLAMTLAGLLSPLQSPRILDMLCPAPHERFNINEFLSGRHTMYLMSGSGESPINPLITMLADTVVREAQKLSQQRPGEILWPPLRLVLDEAANVAPIPDLHSIMSDSGGRGITTAVFAQTFAQMEARWGAKNAQAIRDSATLGLFLGGIKEQDLLKHLSNLGGSHEASRKSVSSGKQGRSVTSSTEKRQRFEPETISKVKIPDSVPGAVYAEAYMVYRNLQPAIIRLRPWWKHPQAKELKASDRTAQEKSKTPQETAHG